MKRLIITMIIVSAIISCKKDWLDKKSNKDLVIPGTLNDCQLILDNNDIMNLRDPAWGEMGSDNYFKYYNDWITRGEKERSVYIWAEGDAWAEQISEWDSEYKKIFYANSVLSILDKIEKTSSNETEMNHLRGSALYFRGTANYNLVNLFTKPYDPITSATDPGIPLKLSADINATSSRGTVKDCFERIITDLSEAIMLLPGQVDFKTRPSRAAAEAKLSDVYLTMGDYDKALIYADAALAFNNYLLDFNNLNPAASSPFMRFNDEVILHNTMITTTMLLLTTYVDSNLYSSYHQNDLRKVLYFTSRPGGYIFKGSYNQNILHFTGLATDELYLIKAECLARKNNVPASMGVLNALLVTRWKTGTFVPFTAITKAEALTKILAERRKELIFRGRRWQDLRRLNKEAPFRVTLKRVLNGVEYTLPPEDSRYTYPIPLNEIRLSGFTQNPR